MGLIRLRSTNPKLSFVIKKNPAKGMIAREIRSGQAFGFYAQGTEDTYLVYFRDAGENSFRPRSGDKEYLDPSQYTSPLIPFAILAEFFGANLRAQEADDGEGFQHSFEIAAIQIKGQKLVPSFRALFPQFALAADLLTGNTYKVTVSTSRPLHHLVNYINLLCMCVAVKNDLLFELDADKNFRALNLLEAPYLIRNAIKVHIPAALFRQVKAKLETPTIHLRPGNAQAQRFDFVRSKLRFASEVLDVGCGEGFYAVPLAPSLPADAIWHAVDVDEQVLEQLRGKAEEKQVMNIATYSGIDAFLEGYGGQPMEVVVSEVIEHMEAAQAAELVRRVLQRVRFTQAVLTTPNREFNRHFLLADGARRHDDHHFEWTRPELEQWLTAVVAGLDLSVHYCMVGDCVEGEGVSLGAIITPAAA